MSTPSAASLSPALPKLRCAIGSIVVPGDRIGTVREVLSGLGTYVKGGHIYASRVGTLDVQFLSTKHQPTTNDGKTENDVEQTTGSSQEISAPTEVSVYVTVIPSNRNKHVTTSTSTTSFFVPSDYVLHQGQIVLARALRLTNMQVHLEILACSLMRKTATSKNDQNDCPILPYPYQGILRREDIRPPALAASGVVGGGSTAPPDLASHLPDCFRPRDIVLCRILSLGDAPRRPYLLSTAEHELGVVHAICATSGHPMHAVSWKEMQCPVTGRKELRKCARPPASN